MRDPVRDHTASEINREIRERTERGIEAVRDSPARISERLDALDREWDVERMIALTSASATLFGLAMARGARSRWLILPAVVAGYEVQCAVQGWCPPLPLLRRLGYRTRREIERERYTLRSILRERVDAGTSDRGAESPRTRRDGEGERRTSGG